MKYESKMIGMNPFWISVLLTTAFLIVSTTGGSNVDWGYLGFEVIFPFYAAIVIGEWCKTRTDPMFDVIAAQTNALFIWVARRFLLLFGITTSFSILGIIGITAITQTARGGELMLIFLITGFFLSSLCVFLSLLISVPHIPTMMVGVTWLFSLMSMSLLRFRIIQYCYLFARFVGINNPIWVINKLFLLLVSCMLWIGIYFICRKRPCT